MFEWTLIRFLHVLGIVFFVGGQLVLAAAVAPVMRSRDPEVMRTMAKRFGIGSAVALVVIIVTGVLMAGEFHRWEDSVLQAKVALLVLVGVLLPLHVVSAYTRAISLGILAASLVIVWLGIELAHG
jgi:uncharacterized membrane protein